MNEPFKDGMCSPKNTIYNMKVTAVKLADHLFQEIWPLLWEIFSSNNTDSITKLNVTKLNMIDRCMITS